MSISAETHAFLSAMYRGSRGYLTLTALPPSSRHAPPSRHIALHHPDQLAEGLTALLHQNHAGWSAVFSVATRRRDLGRWRRGSGAALATLPALFVDIDRSPAVALAALDAYPLPPSATVLSGGGVHAYWWLDEPTQDWGRAEATLRGLSRALDGDRTHPAGAMRLPGTINPKPDRGGARCRLHTLTLNRYPLSAFPAEPQRATRSHFNPRHRHGPGGKRKPPEASGSERLNPDLIRAVEAALLTGGGFYKANGWLAAHCPYPHKRDAPGMHFAFNPALGMGVCQGRHGRLLTRDICTQLNISIQAHGGLYVRN